VCPYIYYCVALLPWSSPKIFADDASLPVLDPGRGRTKTGHLWCYAVDDRPWCGPSHPAVAYIYAEGRKNARPADISCVSMACCRWTDMAASSVWPASVRGLARSVQQTRDTPVTDVLHRQLQGSEHCG
jgi:hypothetical protein